MPTQGLSFLVAEGPLASLIFDAPILKRPARRPTPVGQTRRAVLGAARRCTTSPRLSGLACDCRAMLYTISTASGIVIEVGNVFALMEPGGACLTKMWVPCE